MGEKKKFGNYYLGLDMGSDSVGWAVTDPEYRILRLNQKAMWGARLFEEAETAADRRVFRIARRRIQRRNQRLALLQDLFSSAVCEKDPEFFVRLRESMLHEEDKSIPGKNAVFADKDFDDKAYHRRYPTIYHLRSELIHSDSPHDIRLVYLAVHHILKYRGHFLFEGSLTDASSFNDMINRFCELVSESMGEPFECSDPAKMKGILCNRNMQRSEKQKQLFSLFGCKGNSSAGMLLKALTGAPVSLKKLFALSSESEEDIKIEFGNETYDENVPWMEALLGEDFLIIEQAKAIHDWAILEEILHGHAFLSDAKVALYNDHASDLKKLKKLVRKHKPEAYKDLFSNPKIKNNYCAYIGMAKTGGKKTTVESRCTQADFNKYVLGLLSGVKNPDKELQMVLDKLAAGTFMPKLRTKDNSVIPNQIHLRELQAILQNASKYIPFLREKDQSGLSGADKILQILTFRIPYYVGPLNNRDPHAKNTWVVRKSQEKIYPWNFDEIVDREMSAAKFITRMTAQCTYLKDRTVLPQNSLLYSKFTVLNELNNLRVKGEPITVGLKQDIYRDCFLKRKKVTLSTLVKYLQAKGLSVSADDITGIDGTFHTSLKPWIEMKELLGDRFSQDIAEGIIHLCTVLGDDQKMLRSRIQQEYGSVLSEEIITNAARKHYTGWGRLSAAFLTEIQDSKPDPDTGEFRNIITSMWETNENLMRLLSRDYGFADAVNAYNRRNEQVTDFTYSAVNDLYVSPAIKRSIWQTLSIVKEIRKITGHDPDKVFVEMARGGGEKNKRTISRKNQLVSLYRQCKDETRDWLKELDAKDDSAYRSDRLYLYYTQMGKCMYTGEPIDLDKIYDQTVYDVDHIFPRSKVEDDSLDNRVLVKRIKNAEKTDLYPIEPEIRQRMHPFWSMLQQKGLISKKKYERLVRATPLTTDELTDFVARQLVETRQGTKAVAELLQQLLPDTAIVYVKAGLVSKFRQNYDLLKCREVNDLHHGKDAYLNIVVGNVYHTKFTSDPRNFFKQPQHEYSLRKMYDFEVKRGNVCAWIPGEGGTLSTVKDQMMKNNVLVTRMVHDSKGKLFDTMLKKKGEWQLPMKQSPEFLNDPGKYGGYNKVAGAYFMLVEHTVKGDRKRSIIDMPLHLSNMEKGSQAIIQMLEKDKGLTDPVVILPHIGIHSVIEVDGFRMYLTGRTGDNLVYAHAHQLIVGYENEKYLRDVLKFCERAGEYARLHRGQELSITEYDQISSEKNLMLYDLFVSKLQNTIYQIKLSSQAEKLANARDEFVELSIVKQCETLKQVLNLFTCNRVSADLKALGLGGQVGVISTNRTVSSYKSAKLVSQSVTGLFEKATDLLK